MKGGFCLARFCQAAIQPLMKHHHAGGVSCFKNRISTVVPHLYIWFDQWRFFFCDIACVLFHCNLWAYHLLQANVNCTSFCHMAAYTYMLLFYPQVFIYIYLYIIYTWFSCLSIMSKWLFTVFDPLKRICIQIRYMYVWLHHYLSSFTWQ